MRAAYRRGHGRHPGFARRDLLRTRGRPRVPGRGRIVERTGRDRRPAGQGPGPRGGHRQDPPGPAVDRLLRQGTRRPALQVVRTWPVRRPLRARGHRLSRPATSAGPSAATWNASSTSSPARRSRSRRSSPASSRWRTRRLSMPTWPRVRSRPSASCSSTRHRPWTSPSKAATSLVRAAPAVAPRGGKSDGRLAIGFIGAGNYASATLAAAPGRAAGRLPGARRDDPVAIRGQRPAAVRLHHGLDQCRRGARGRHPRRDLHRDPPSHARGPGLPCPADRARRSSWRSPSP